MGDTEYTLEPIGFVRTPFSDTKDIPKGPCARHDADGTIDVLPAFEAGLADIDGFSHLYVIWLFHRVEGYNLVSTPPTDDRPHGVFASRSPHRPNRIGLTVVRLIGRTGRSLHVGGVDMLDGSPVVDIKPYLSNVPEETLRRGWVAEAERRRANAQRR